MDAATPEALALDLYAALTDSRDLEPALNALARRLGADMQITFELQLGPRRIAGARKLAMMNVDPEVDPEYRAHWIQRDPRMGLIAGLPPGVANISSLLPAETFARSAVWNEFTRQRIGSFHCMTATIVEQDEVRTCFGLFRTEAHDPFGTEEEALLRMVGPHLRRVLAARYRMAAATPEPALTTAIDALPHGVALLSPGPRLIRANAALERMAARADGFILARHGLYCPEAAPRRALAHAVDTALATAEGKVRMLADAGTVAIPRPSGAAPWLVQAIPLMSGERPPPWLREAGPAGFRGVMLMVMDAETRLAPSMALLRQQLSLTPAEAALTTALVRGLSLREYAESRGVSLETLRSQLAAIRRKTGTRRQADLISLVNRLIPP